MLGREYYLVCQLFGTAKLFYSGKLAPMMEVMWTWFVLPASIASCAHLRSLMVSALTLKLVRSGEILDRLPAIPERGFNRNANPSFP